MAIDEAPAGHKTSASLSRRNSMATTKNGKNDNPHVGPTRSGHLLARKHRIERWALKGRSASSSGGTASSAAIGNLSSQDRSESSFFQIGRLLNAQLLQLGEQRQKKVDQRNFEQKLFANKQAIRHRDNPAVLRTLSYVRKCCKYVDTNDDEDDPIDPTMFLEEGQGGAAKRSRSRSPTATPPPVKRTLSAQSRTQTSASLAETFLRHNKKSIDHRRPASTKSTESKATTSPPPTTTSHTDPAADDETQKRHVQFRINSDGARLASQSAFALTSSPSFVKEQQPIRNVISASAARRSSSTYQARTTNSAPPKTAPLTPDKVNDPQRSPKPKPKPKRRSPSRILSAKSSVKDFQLHPERFLSATNRYLPLLRRSAFEFQSREMLAKQQNEKNELLKKQQRIAFSPPISRLSDGSDLTYDDAKSFLSDELEIGKSTLPRSHSHVWPEQEHGKSSKKNRPLSKIDLMETVADDSTERTMAIARLREREFAHLRELVRSNQIDQILESFSVVKTDQIEDDSTAQQKVPSYIRQYQEAKQPVVASAIVVSEQPLFSPRKPNHTRHLADILHSIDSLRCSDAADKRARRQVDMEKNRARLGILLF